MSIATNDRLQIRLYSTCGDQTAINVLNFVVGAVVGIVDEQPFINAVSTKMSLAMVQLQSAESTYYGADLRVYSGGALGPTWTSRSGTAAGSQPGDVLPRQVAGVIGWQTLTPGRPGRGRTFVPFPPEQMSSGGGHPDTLYVGALGNLANQIRSTTPYVASTGNTAVLNFTLRNRASNAFVLVVNHVARAKWGNQRRRGDYGKKNVPGF
jgi:hypothetical protein